MLQTLTIPSNPLPEVPSAQAGAAGDAGERAEFAQLLQQAKAEPDATPDAPRVATAKDARAEGRAKTDAPRGAPDRKSHDVRKARTDVDTIELDAEAIDAVGCLPQGSPSDASAIATDTVSAPERPRRDPAGASTEVPDVVLPALMPVAEPMPSAAAAAASPTAGDERASNGRFGMRFGARDMRLPAQPEATPGAAADAGITRPAADAAGPAQDARFDLAMQQAGSGRGTMPLAPLERAPLEPTPGAAQAMTVARDWHHPLARTDAAAEATLRTAPDEAAFAPALGAQVALWVKDGVQQARLQLHPAELGPVTVQIALDGRAAHVDFTAAVAATRESIEQSLPALAAALRESGFTLAGGGVFGHSNPGTGEQGRERAPEGRAAGNRRVSAAIGGDEGAAPGAALPRRWSRSLVDVYA